MNWFLLAWHRLFFFLRFQRIHRDQRVVRQTEASVFLGDGSQNDENCKVVWLWYNYNPNVVGSVSGEVSMYILTTFSIEGISTSPNNFIL